MCSFWTFALCCPLIDWISGFGWRRRTEPAGSLTLCWLKKASKLDSMSSYGHAICVVTATTVISALSNAGSQPRTQLCFPDAGYVVECIKPFETDPAIRRFDTAHYVVFNADTGPDANLLVFLPGTGGEPPGPVPFLKMAVDAGYRVISLAYTTCPRLRFIARGNLIRRARKISAECAFMVMGRGLIGP